MANSKATELGADSFIVVEMDRSVVKLTQIKFKKIRTLAKDY